MKTYKELGITKKEYNAAIKVRDGLREGRYVHQIGDEYVGNKMFNMNVCYNTRSCGTVACIGGWMNAVMRTPKEDRGSLTYTFSAPLHPVFFPDYDGDWDKITPKRAASAIDNFLKTGDPNWNRVMR